MKRHYLESIDINVVSKVYDNREIFIKIDKKCFRPTEDKELLGDYSNAKKKLDWKTKISSNKLMSEIIKNYSKLVKKEVGLKNREFIVMSHKE